MQKLCEDAEAYADLACKHLVLEPVFDVKPISDDADPLEQFAVGLSTLLAHATRENPEGLTCFKYRSEFILHFLFPNLSVEERNAIGDVAALASSIYGSRINHHVPNQRELGKWREKRDALAGLETKLTVVQMALLDSSLCDPDSNVEGPCL